VNIVTYSDEFCCQFLFHCFEINYYCAILSFQPTRINPSPASNQVKIGKETATNPYYGLLSSVMFETEPMTVKLSLPESGTLNQLMENKEETDNDKVEENFVWDIGLDRGFQQLCCTVCA
jgi:hypothetical protein